MATPPPQPGGFILSPPASTITTTSTMHPTLPHPRDTPLRPGGSKESAFIRHCDAQLLHIQRRFAKRTSPSSQFLSEVDRDKADTWGDVQGYNTMSEACKDLGELVDIVWVSGTPGLQVPYLISIGLLLGNVVQGMPPSPKALFRVLGKLDLAFAGLMQGRDAETGERLPGFEGGGRRGVVSGTEKVRIRSLVERTRVGVVEVFKRGEFEYEDEEGEGEGDSMDIETETDDEGRLVLEGDDHEETPEESLDMQIARVYDRTMVELGDSLEEPSIGVLTEGRGRG
ncbi:hypothetical protein M409DRAFT_52435 [Zasmidium cellare ATCC 36951]|uniref:Uncharacterized protein n=1 Tax=Zasmidium cellare ATCC 36951 TaxID=1080233 RepID=A0A6A6CQ08_ZASCE|nr:uncharacterized protein M409DRAFT_52435 [Zasmidium cellare ATCC 36951]KAF2169151.1 hypothetical protein M409DRAFT_52435 [Zasmidium cellare ATCC 36951]